MLPERGGDGLRGGLWPGAPEGAAEAQADEENGPFGGGEGQLFGDEEIRKEVLACSDPRQIKALGRKVRGFDQKVWDKFKYAIVLNGNWCKFSQNRDLREFLLSTGDSVLVEASPYDNIWGIRLAASSQEAQDPTQWRGQNLLGFALMEVRDELRRVTQNEMLCD